MINIVQNWLTPTHRPIGVDFGTDCLRMAQVQFHGGEPRLIAAGSADVPFDLHGNQAGRAEFFVRKVREILATGNFRGRQILLALPAALTSIISVAVSATEQARAKEKIAAAVGQTLGIDPGDALIREVVIAEANQEALTREVAVIAAPRSQIHSMLAAAAEARLEVVGMNVEPSAIIDCFSHVYRRRGDLVSTTCFVDIGACRTRLVVARAEKIFDACTIPMGGLDFTGAVAKAAAVSIDEARLLRLKICHADTQLEEHHDKRELYVARSVAGSADIERQRKIVDAACRGLLRNLIQKIEEFRGRFSQRFGSSPIDRLVFVGGEAHNRVLCRSIARAMGLSALVGDPLLRMSRPSDVGFGSGIDRREPQPAWAVAIGLSLGPPASAPIDDRRARPLSSHLPRWVHLTENKR